MQVGLDKLSFSQLQSQALVGLDKHFSALVFIFNKIFSISSGYGRTEFYFPTCIKPCSLAAILYALVKTNLS
jgi:hypothetical protein